MADSALSGLREIAPPPPVAYTPQTVGWLLVALLLTAAIAYFAWRYYQHRRANRYRRYALAELDAIAAKLRVKESRHAALASVPALVKRTALAFAPREKIASLTDAAWLVFLDETYPNGGFVDGPGRILAQLAYASDSDGLPDAEISGLLLLVRGWIERHHARV